MDGLTQVSKMCQNFKMKKGFLNFWQKFVRISDIISTEFRLGFYKDYYFININFSKMFSYFRVPWLSNFVPILSFLSEFRQNYSRILMEFETTVLRKESKKLESKSIQNIWLLFYSILVESSYVQFENVVSNICMWPNFVRSAKRI